MYNKVCMNIHNFNEQERNMGQRLNIILIAEGAIDTDGKSITADQVKNVGLWIFILYN